MFNGLLASICSIGWPPSGPDMIRVTCRWWSIPLGLACMAVALAGLEIVF
jgi:hypothetical protein